MLALVCKEIKDLTTAFGTEILATHQIKISEREARIAVQVDYLLNDEVL